MGGLGLSPDLARILDANANRAREGLRVVEDILRLGRQDGRSSGKVRDLRRRITDRTRRRFGGDRLMGARDADSDPGGGRRDGGDRLPRRNLGDLMTANFRRCQESLRVMEEIDRLLGGRGRGFRELRFRAYQLERDLFVGSRRRGRHPRRG